MINNFIAKNVNLIEDRLDEYSKKSEVIKWQLIRLLSRKRIMTKINKGFFSDNKYVENINYTISPIKIKSLDGNEIWSCNHYSINYRIELVVSNVKYIVSTTFQIRVSGESYDGNNVEEVFVPVIRKHLEDLDYYINEQVKLIGWQHIKRHRDLIYKD